jgi:hypothetical protein
MIIDTDGFGAPFKVTGVCENVPKNSSFQFDILVFGKYHPQRYSGIKSSSGTAIGLLTCFVTYLLLKDHANAAHESVAAKIKTAAAAHLTADEKTRYILAYSHFTNIHFYSEDIDNSAERNNSVGRMGDITYIYVFADCRNICAFDRLH